MNTLIEIHVLQNFAPSNLNRDDTGAPKDAIFGGTRRARISSQCLKRSVRNYFHEKQKGGLFSEEDLAVRTKLAYESIAKGLDGKRDKSEAMTKAEIALSYIGLKGNKKNNTKTEYLLFLGKREIEKFAKVIDEEWEKIVSVHSEESEDSQEKETTDDDDKQKKVKAKKQKEKGKVPKEVVDRLMSILDGGKAVDLALFGRMLADIPEKNQNAACQVAHAISTHAVEREFDYFTALDDLKPDDTAGSDMIGTVEFNSACFYRYAVIDWEKLLSNLQDDRELALKGLKAFLVGFVVAEPTGKQNTFAAHNPPEFVVVSVRHDAGPRNLANAFEAPVRMEKGEPLTKTSAEKLVEKAKVLQSVFGGKEETFILNAIHAEIDKYGEEVVTLAEALDKTILRVRE